MSKKKLSLLLAALLLTALAARAQGAPPVAPDPGYQQVSVPVPRAVSLVVDVVGALFSRNEAADKVQALVDRRRERSKKGSQSLDFSVPKNGLTRTLGLVEE